MASVSPVTSFHLENDSLFQDVPTQHALWSPLFQSEEEGKTLLLECGDGAVFMVMTQAGERLRWR